MNHWLDHRKRMCEPFVCLCTDGWKCLLDTAQPFARCVSWSVDIDTNVVGFRSYNGRRTLAEVIKSVKLQSGGVLNLWFSFPDVLLLAYGQKTELTGPYDKKRFVSNIHTDIRSVWPQACIASPIIGVHQIFRDQETYYAWNGGQKFDLSSTAMIREDNNTVAVWEIGCNELVEETVNLFGRDRLVSRTNRA